MGRVGPDMRPTPSHGRSSWHPFGTGCASDFAQDGKWFLGPALGKQIPVPVWLHQIGLSFMYVFVCLKRIPCPRWENLHSLEHHCARRCGCFHVSLKVNHREPAAGQGMVSGRVMAWAPLSLQCGYFRVFSLHHFGLEWLVILESEGAFKDCLCSSPSLYRGGNRLSKVVTWPGDFGRRWQR